MTLHNKTVWKRWKGVTLKLLLLIESMGSTQDLWPKRFETTFQKKEPGNSSGRSVEDVSERQFYPWVQKASRNVYLKFNTNLQHAVSIPHPVEFESHIKHLTLNFYTFQVNESLIPPPPPRKKKETKVCSTLEVRNQHSNFICFICKTWSVRCPESRHSK
jgi:hypothetical protein